VVECRLAGIENAHQSVKHHGRCRSYWQAAAAVGNGSLSSRRSGFRAEMQGRNCLTTAHIRALVKNPLTFESEFPAPRCRRVGGQRLHTSPIQDRSSRVPDLYLVSGSGGSGKVLHGDFHFPKQFGKHHHWAWDRYGLPKASRFVKGAELVESMRRRRISGWRPKRALWG